MSTVWKRWVGRFVPGRSTSTRVQTKPNTSNTKSREVRIGLDLGTANTRCVVNVLGGPPSRDSFVALALDGNSTCLPSTVAVDGDRLLIGQAAEALDNAHRSVLMWLPMLAGESVDTSCSGKYGRLQQTVFNFGDHMISAKEVLILFMERVFGRVITTLDSQYGRSAWHGSIRLACPAHASKRYRELLQEVASLGLDLACAASANRDRTPNMTDSLSGLTERYQRGNGRGCDNALVIEIVPAGEAAVAALASRVTFDEARRVVLVDLGAGATSVTMCSIEGDHVEILGTTGTWHGMDDVDQLLATSRAVRRRAPRSFREAEGLRPSDRPMIRRGLDRLVGVLPALMTQLTGGGRSAEGWVSHRRAAFDIVLLGGGSCCTLLVDEFKRREQSPMPTVVSFWDIDTLVVESLPLLGGSDRRTRQVTAAELPLLTIARGLADRAVSIAAPSQSRTTESAAAPRAAVAV